MSWERSPPWGQGPVSLRANGETGDDDSFKCIGPCGAHFSTRAHLRVHLVEAHREELSVLGGSARALAADHGYGVCPECGGLAKMNKDGSLNRGHSVAACSARKLRRRSLPGFEGVRAIDPPPILRPDGDDDGNDGNEASRKVGSRAKATLKSTTATAPATTPRKRRRSSLSELGTSPKTGDSAGPPPPAHTPSRPMTRHSLANRATSISLASAFGRHRRSAMKRVRSASPPPPPPRTTSRRALSFQASPGTSQMPATPKASTPPLSPAKTLTPPKSDDDEGALGEGGPPDDDGSSPSTTPPVSPATSNDAEAELNRDEEDDDERSFPSTRKWKKFIFKTTASLSAELTATVGPASEKAHALFRGFLLNSRLKVIKPAKVDFKEPPPDAAPALKVGNQTMHYAMALAKKVKAAPDARIQKALHFLHSNMPKNVRPTLTSFGLADLTDELVVTALKEKYPERDDDDDDFDPAVILGACGENADVPVFTAEQVRRALYRKKRGGASDIHGWDFDMIKQLCNEWQDFQWFTDIVNAIAQGRLNNDPATTALARTLRGIALRKHAVVPTKVRPIGIGNLAANIAATLLRKHNSDALNELAGPRQFGTRVCGVEVVGRSMLFAHEMGFTVAAQDGANAHNSMYRRTVLEAVKQVPQLGPLTMFALGGDPTVEYSIGRGPNADVLRIAQEQGAAQGWAPLTSLYNIGQAPTIAAVMQEYKNIGYNVMTSSFCDDHGTVGPADQAVDAAIALAERLKKTVGVTSGTLQVMPGKNEEIDDELRNTVAAAKGTLEHELLVFAGTPIGTDAAIKAWVMEKAQEVIRILSQAEEMVIAGGNTTVQAVVRYLRVYTHPIFTFVLRVVDPALTREAARTLDDAFFNTVLRISGLNLNYANASAFDRSRARKIFTLPTSLSGCGFTSYAATADAAFVGSMAATLSAVVARESGLGLNKPAPDEDLPSFLRPYEDALERLRLRLPLAATEGLDARSIWNEAKSGEQHALSQASHEAAWRDLLREEKAKDDSSFDGRYAINSIIGTRDDAAGAWLTADPSKRNCAMTNSRFCEALCGRLMLPRDIIVGPCTKCASAVTQTGAHAHVCHLAQAERTTGHTGVCRALQGGIQMTGDVVRNEPLVRIHYPRKQGAEGGPTMGTINKKADISVLSKNSLAGDCLLIDVRVTGTTLTAVPTVAYLKAGDAAAAAEEAKMNEYKAWDIPKGRLVPFLIESTGALGPKAKELLADTAKRMGPMRLFGANYRYLCEAVSVAVQVTVQSQIVSLRFSQAEAARARGAAAG